jgi:hypothetical protein
LVELHDGQRGGLALREALTQCLELLRDSGAGPLGGAREQCGRRRLLAVVPQRVDEMARDRRQSRAVRGDQLLQRFDRPDRQHRRIEAEHEARALGLRELADLLPERLGVLRTDALERDRRARELTLGLEVIATVREQVRLGGIEPDQQISGRSAESTHPLAARVPPREVLVDVFVGARYEVVRNAMRPHRGAQAGQAVLDRVHAAEDTAAKGV